MGLTPGLWIALAALVVALAGVFLVRVVRRRWREFETRQAIRLFRLRREMLEAKFFDLARGRGKPKGLRWLECQWLDSVTFARDRQTKLLTAFVGVNIRFEAVEGGDMEDVEAVSLIRDAAAVFHYRRGVWGTGGRALFNMNPHDAVDRLAGQYDPVPNEIHH